MQLWYHSCLTSLDHMVSKFKRNKYELLENPPVLTSKLFRKKKAIKTRNMKWQFYINKGPNHFYSLLNICYHITFRKNLSKQIFQKCVFVFLGPRMSMVWRGVWGRPFQISPPPPPFQFMSPSNSGLQGHSFQPLNITSDPLSKINWKQNVSNWEDFK